MTKKTKRPCSSPGCPELTDGRFCPEHAKKEASRYEKYQRDPETRKRYGRAWKRIRDRYITAHPLCEECKRQGKLTPAAEVHHILPLSRGGTHDESNLMALCTPCHSAITARDGDRWGTRQGESYLHNYLNVQRAWGFVQKVAVSNGVITSNEKRGE